MLGNYYLVGVAVHVIFVIFWMAGLFMMPRYFAYHMETEPGSDEEQKWVDREKRLLRIIMNPAMIIAWIAGLTIAFEGLHYQSGWFHAKLAVVLGLTAYHMILARTRRQLATGDRSRSSKFFRLINEVPAFGIIAAVVFVEVKPF